MKINLYNRKMTLLLTSGIIFIMMGIMMLMYVIALYSTTSSTQYMLYRYIVSGHYENAPINYIMLLVPCIVAGITGLLLCIVYILKSKKGQWN